MASAFTNCLPLACFGGNSSKIRQINILTLGLNGAGKTTILRSLQGENLAGISTTVGFDNLSLTINGNKINAYDVGGGSGIRGIWKNYYYDAHGIVYVIDASDVDTLAENRSILKEVINHEKIRTKPILILANKQDESNALDKLSLAKQFQLEKLLKSKGCPYHVEACTTKIGTKSKADKSIRLGFKWLIDTIKKDDQLLERVAQDIREQKEIDALERKERQAKAKARRERQERESNANHKDAASTDEDDDPFKQVVVTGDDMYIGKKKVTKSKGKNKKVKKSAVAPQSTQSYRRQSSNSDDDDNDDVVVGNYNASKSNDRAGKQRHLEHGNHVHTNHSSSHHNKSYSSASKSDDSDQEKVKHEQSHLSNKKKASNKMLTHSYNEIVSDEDSETDKDSGHIQEDRKTTTKKKVKWQQNHDLAKISRYDDDEDAEDAEDVAISSNKHRGLKLSRNYNRSDSDSDDKKTKLKKGRGKVNLSRYDDEDDSEDDDDDDTIVTNSRQRNQKLSNKHHTSYSNDDDDVYEHLKQDDKKHKPKKSKGKRNKISPANDDIIEGRNTLNTNPWNKPTLNDLTLPEISKKKLKPLKLGPHRSNPLSNDIGASRRRPNEEDDDIMT